MGAPSHCNKAANAADAGQIDEPIDRAQQVIRRHMTLEAEALEQRLLHHRPLAHHPPISRFDTSIESDRHGNFKREFFNTIHPLRTFVQQYIATFRSQ